MIVFQVSIKFWSSERNTENMMSHLHFNEESEYSVENTCKNEVFRSTILHHRKNTKHIHAPAADLFHIVLEKEISIGANAAIWVEYIPS